MAVEHDYYELLGIARDVGDADIKKAFRRLARERHPDVSDAPDAEEQFKEIVEAYEVLSNPERRQLYDRFGHAGLRTGGFVPTAFDLGSISDLFSAFFGDDLFGGSGRSRRGADAGAEIEIGLEDAAKGVSVPLSLRLAATCGACDGSGAEPGTHPVTCSTCSGSGRLQRVSRTAFGEFVRTQACPQCAGAGSVVEHPCVACGGAGQVVEERTVEVEVPAGIHDGQRIRLAGEGHAGGSGGTAGDAYVLVHVLADPRFVRDGNDLYSSVDLTLTQAALGTTLSVETIDGLVELEIDAGAQPGDVRVLRGRGMPVLQGRGRGDHRLLLNVVVPRRLSADQRRVLEELRGVEDAHMYADDEGFVERLRARFR